VAANEIVFKVKVEKDGNLSVVAKQAEKAAKGTDQLTRSTDNLDKKRRNYNKTEKGVGQAGLSSAKSFSKMRQQIGGGSSGLVGAYAVLAANIFALTAAFGALQRAAQVQQLEEGLTSLGTASGVALKSVSRGLREATGNALSLEDSMRSVALASSAGFDSTSIERLGDVARKASIALGRDTADSLNRLTKGAIKLEPELLDELGIMVRLDDATTKYATALNKSAGDLTTFEKRQAFMNAVLEEGERKFAAMGNVKTNAYDQLSATFADLTKNLLNFLNNGLLPIVNFFAGSQVALFGAMTLFAKGIATQMIPGLANLGKKYVEARHAAAQYSLEQLKGLKTLDGGGKKLKKLAAAFDPAIHGQRELTAMMNTAENSLKSNQSQLQGVIDKEGLMSAATNKKILTIEASKTALRDITQYQKDYTASLADETKASAVSAAASGDFGDAMGFLTQAKEEMGQETERNNVGLGRGEQRMNRFGLAARQGALSMRVFGTAFLNAIPMIGQIIFALGVFISIADKVMDYFKSSEQKDYEDMVKKQAEANLELAESMKAVDSFNKGSVSVISSITQKYTALFNVYTSLTSQITALNKQSEAGLQQTEMTMTGYKEVGPYKSVLDTMIASGEITEASMEKAMEGMAKYTKKSYMASFALNGLKNINNEMAKVLVNKLIPGFGDVSRVMKNMTMSVKEANQAVDEFTNTASFKTSVDNVLAAFSNINKAMKDRGSETASDWIEGFKQNAGPNLSNLIDFDKLEEEARKAIPAAGYSPELDLARQEKVRKLAEERVATLVKGFKLQRKTERLVKGEIAGLNATNKMLKRNNLIQGNGSKIVENNNLIAQEEIKLIKNKQANYELIATHDKNSDHYKKRILAFEREITNLQDSATGEGAKQLADEQDKLAILTHQNAARKESLELLTKMANMAKTLATLEEARITRTIEAANRADPNRGYNSTMNAADKLKANKTAPERATMRVDGKGNVTMEKEKSLLDIKRQTIQNEFNITMLKLDLERKMLEARMRVVDAELQAAHERSGGTGDYADRGTMRGVIEDLGEDGSFQAVGKAVARAVRTGAKEALDASVAKTEEEQRGEILGAGGSTSAEVVANQNEAGGLGALKNTSDVFAGLGNSINPMIENLKQLGPEGELVASVAQGALAIGGAWALAAEKIDAGAVGMKKASIIAGAVSQTISQIGSIMAASSKNKVAGIDKEIEAEKKRDGKSKESLAKIKGLEKKKEATQRKAFEQNKKMQMASVVASTAAAIMGVVSGVKSFWEAPLAIAMAGIFAGMGAAQLAVISGTSYSGGGGGGGGAAVPGSVSLGQRRNTVDTGKSQGAAGELAYLRGAKGVGGPENFRGAFYGKKHRAAGGDTGYIVGEQGPELFMPDRPGTIVPADDTAAMGGGSNVTFNISTVDATGVEDLLAEQQGNIIGMLRQAANSYGEEFMEDIDTTAVSGSSARRA